MSTIQPDLFDAAHDRVIGTDTPEPSNPADLSREVNAQLDVKGVLGMVSMSTDMLIQMIKLRTELHDAHHKRGHAFWNGVALGAPLGMLALLAGWALGI